MYIYLYIDIVMDVPDTSGESKNNIGGRRPKKEREACVVCPWATLEPPCTLKVWDGGTASRLEDFRPFVRVSIRF